MSSSECTWRDCTEKKQRRNPATSFYLNYKNVELFDTIYNDKYGQRVSATSPPIISLPRENFGTISQSTAQMKTSTTLFSKWGSVVFTSVIDTVFFLNPAALTDNATVENWVNFYSQYSVPNLMLDWMSGIVHHDINKVENKIQNAKDYVNIQENGYLNPTSSKPKDASAGTFVNASGTSLLFNPSGTTSLLSASSGIMDLNAPPTSAQIAQSTSLQSRANSNSAKISGSISTAPPTTIQPQCIPPLSTDILDDSNLVKKYLLRTLVLGFSSLAVYNWAWLLFRVGEQEHNQLFASYKGGGGPTAQQLSDKIVVQGVIQNRDVAGDFITKGVTKEGSSGSSIPGSGIPDHSVPIPELDGIVSQLLHIVEVSQILRFVMGFADAVGVVREALSEQTKHWTKKFGLFYYFV